MKAFWLLGVACLALTLASGNPGTPPKIGKGDGRKGAPKGILTSFWSLPKKGDAVALLVAGQTEPARARLSADTVLAGTCHDCLQYLPFSIRDAGRACSMCGCGAPNTQCVAWKPLKHNTWQETLRALPPGVGLWVIYNQAENPESGVKHLGIDRHSVLLPVEGLRGWTPERLLALVLPVGGTDAALLAGDRQLLFFVKDDWTTEREAQFEKELVRAGGRLAYPAEGDAWSHHYAYEGSRSENSP
ncbi:MAG TPA: hypothetical protein VFA07_19635 [Chthonomonadaceae bacterium]|nr:hypothetical protein [Chthonomonadaceae bacterium]